MKKRILPALLSLVLLAGCAGPELQPETEQLPPTTDVVEAVSVSSSCRVYDSSRSGTAPGASNTPDAVTFEISLPRVELEDEEIEGIINQYYQDLGDQLYTYATGELGEQLAEPTDTAALRASFEVTYLRDGILSISRRIQSGLADESGDTLFSETFNLENGGLMILDDFFTVSEEEYTALLTDQVLAALADVTGLYGDWEETVVNAFDKNAFYLKDDTLVLYYQAGALGATLQVVSIPVSTLGEAFALPECFT